MLAYIGIGSNLGDKRKNCRLALEAVSSDPRNRLVRCSPLYRTEPVGKTDQDWFVNGAAAVETSMGPRELLRFLLSVEGGMGRVRKERWGPRTIDLDLLFYGEEILNLEDLQVPHPRLHERRFVLVPLKEIAPGLIHPLRKKTVSQMLAELGSGEEVLPLPAEEGEECTA